MNRTPSVPVKLAMRRGRPSAEEVARIEGTILGAARNMFLTGGFDGVSMEGVASAAGITRATLYSRYASKAALFRAVVEETVSLWYANSRVQATDAGMDIGLILRMRISDMAALLVDPLFGALHTLLLSNRHRFPDLAPLMHELGYKKAIELLANDIDAAARRDGLPVRFPEQVAQHIISAIYGWFLEQDLVRIPTAREIEAYGWSLLDMLMLARERW